MAERDEARARIRKRIASGDFDDETPAEVARYSRLRH